MKPYSISLTHLMVAVLAIPAAAQNLPTTQVSWKTNFATYEHRLKNLEAQLAENHGNAYQGELPQGKSGKLGKTFTTTLDCNDCMPGWFVSADYLYWQVERNDMAFAIRDPAGAGVPVSGDPVMSLDLGDNSGLRAGVGWRTSSGWEIGASYTYLRSEDRRADAPGANQVLAVMSSPSTGLTNADSVAASADFKYDVIDFEAAHWIDAGDSLSLQVFAGFRYASIDQRTQAAYDGGQFTNGAIDIASSVEGFGGRIGGGMNWHFRSGFSLFGRTAIGLLASDVNASRVESNAGAVVINASRPSDQITPSVDISLGLRKSFDCWGIAAGYEWTNWFNAVSPLEFSDNVNGGTLAPSTGDLGLHGLFVNATYEY